MILWNSVLLQWLVLSEPEELLTEYTSREEYHHLINCKEAENTVADSQWALFFQRPDDVVPYSHQMTAQWSGFTELRISFVHITAKNPIYLFL